MRWLIIDMIVQTISAGYSAVAAGLSLLPLSILTFLLAKRFGVAAAHRLPPNPLKTVFGCYLIVIAFFMFKSALKF